MNLKTKFVFSTGLLCLLCLMLPSSLRADPVPSLLAGTPVNINITNPGADFVTDLYGGSEGLIWSETGPYYDVDLYTPPAVSYTFIPEECPGLFTPPDCGIYGNTYGPGGSIAISEGRYDSSQRLLYTGSFTSGAGGGGIGSGIWDASFTGTFTLKGIHGSGTLTVYEGVGNWQGGSMDYSGVVTPDPSSFSLMLIGIGFVAVMLKRIA